MMKPNNVLLSIVIRVLNEANYLQSVLKALQVQKRDFEIEIILVDNESNDNSRELGATVGANIVSIPRQEYTPGAALNLGIAQAKGEFILLLSAHCLPIGSGFLQNCIKPFHDSQVAAIRCLSTADGRNLAQWYQPRLIYYATKDEQEIAETGLDWTKDYPTAACCVLRKSVWDEIRFDESLESNEDKEWASRIIGKGLKIQNSAESVFYYMRPLSGPDLWRKQQRQLVALYRFKGYVPLTWRWFFIRVLQAFYEAPGVAWQHIYYKILQNYYLVTVPSKAKNLPRKGSHKDLEIGKNVRH